MMKGMFLFLISLFLLSEIDHRAAEEPDLPSREEVEKNDGSAPPCVGNGKNKETNKQYEILKSGDSLTDKDGNTKTWNGTKRFSDVEIDVNNPRSGHNNIGGIENKKNNSQNDDFERVFGAIAQYVAYTIANRSGTIKLYNIKSRKYEIWVDDSQLDFSGDNIYTVATGQHVIKIRRFGYDDIVFKANVRPCSEFKVVCKFKQSPFYCFDLYTSQDDLNPKLGESVKISFDVNRNVIGKKVMCEIKNEETGVVVFTKEFSNFTTFTQTFTFDGKDKDGNILPDGQYSVNLIYDDNVLSESISIDSTLSASRRIYTKFLFFGSIPKTVSNYHTLQNGSCYGWDFPCNNSAFILNNFRVGGYFNKGLSPLGSLFLYLPISIASIGFSFDRKLYYVQLPIKIKILERYNAMAMDHYALSFAPCINFDIHKLIENNFGGLSNNHTLHLNINNNTKNQLAQANVTNSAAPDPVQEQPVQEPSVQDNGNQNYNPISFDAVLSMTLQHGCSKNSFLVLDLMFNFSGFISRRNDCNFIYVCGSYSIKEMDVFTLALDLKKEQNKPKPYINISYLHRLEFTGISFGCDLRLDFKNFTNSSLALKFIFDF